MKGTKKIFIIFLVYLGILFTPFSWFVFGPIELLVAFFHELGHAVMALITNGHVYSLTVNLDGSGVTNTIGGYRPLIIMGGYIGSCFFSNLLVRLSLTKNSSLVCIILSIVMGICNVFWATSLISSIILLFYIIIFVIFSWIPQVASIFLQFIGISCVIHILQDFRVGPSGDLDQFEQCVGIFPKFVWMYIWLGISIIVTFLNVKQIIKHDSKT